MDIGGRAMFLHQPKVLPWLPGVVAGAYPPTIRGTSTTSASGASGSFQASW